MSVVELGPEGRALTSFPPSHQSTSPQPHAGPRDRPRRRRPDGYPDNSRTILGRQDSLATGFGFCGVLLPTEVPTAAGACRKAVGPSREPPCWHRSSGSPACARHTPCSPQGPATAVALVLGSILAPAAPLLHLIWMKGSDFKPAD